MSSELHFSRKLVAKSEDPGIVFESGFGDEVLRVVALFASGVHAPPVGLEGTF